MATSGSIDWAADRDEIIIEALELLGVLAEGESPTANALTTCARTLNFMVKGWQNRVKHLHAKVNLYVFPDGTSQSFVIDGSTDHITSSYAATTLSADAAAAASTVDVTSITGISDGDFIGVELDDGTIDWDTINGAPSGSTITLTGTLTSAASSGNVVYTYTTKASQPVRISSAYNSDHTDPTSLIDTPMEVINEDDYTNLSLKDTTGRPNQVYADYQRAATNVSIWPVSDTIKNVVVLEAWRKLEDFDAASDDADFPQEWFHTLAICLAERLSPKYGLDMNSYKRIKAMADEALFDAESHESEASIMLMPETRRW